MKKKLVKIFSLILVIVIFQAIGPTALAQGLYQQYLDNLLPVYHAGTDAYALKEYTIATPYEGIVKSADNCYAMLMETQSGEEAIPVGKLDINIADADDIDAVLANDNIEEEIKQHFYTQYEQAVANGITDLPATLFSSSLLSSNVDSTAYTTYNGARMKSDYLYYWNINTDYEDISKGISTADIAEFVVNVALIAGSYASIYVNFISSGISLFQAFVNLYGNSWATGHYSDTLQVKLKYDKVLQWTYREIGDEWHLGLHSQKVTINEIDSFQYYYNSATRTGRDFETHREPHTICQSEHFSSPWATAYQWCNSPLSEGCSWRCGKTTFVF